MPLKSFAKFYFPPPKPCICKLSPKEGGGGLKGDMLNLLSSFCFSFSSKILTYSIARAAKEVSPSIFLPPSF